VEKAILPPILKNAGLQTGDFALKTEKELDVNWYAPHHNVIEFHHLPD